MKTKWIFGIVAVVMILSIVSISQGADRFYYGSYGGKKYPSILRDSLRFNIIQDDFSDTSTWEIDSLAASSLRAIVASKEQEGPTYWAVRSHYTLWEAEGLDGSYANLQYAACGTLVVDTSASGGKAMRFSGPGTPGLIQWGPPYNQESKRWGSFFEYTAEFCLKYLPDTLLDPTTPICSLWVVDTVSHSILKDTILYKSDFDGGGEGSYQIFKLVDYIVPDINRIEFRIYWFGEPGDLYIDYVRVYDDEGSQLMSGLRDDDIMDYVSQDWVHDTIPGGDTVVYRWYLRDEPGTFDLFATNRYVDSLLREVSSERVGFQAFNLYRTECCWVQEYFLRQDPEEYCVDIYPMRWIAHHTSGQAYQESLSYYPHWLNKCRIESQDEGKDLWVIMQTFVEGPELDSGETCCLGCSLYYEDQWYCFDSYKRLPRPNEVRLQTFLALCYGADAILNFYYDTKFFTVEGKQYLRLGLYDSLAEPDSTTAMWREIRDFTGPQVETLGPIFNQLTWQGAGFYEDVATITGSFIDSLKPAPGETLLTTYVQVGFFKDDADTDYFMLVNRQCLENEDQNVTVYVDSASLIGNKKMWHVIDQYSQDTTFTGAINGAIPFTTHLDPGEGKLFKLVAFPDSAFHGTAHPLTWQGGIMIDGDVTVDSAKILVIQPPTKITFFANTDVVKTPDFDTTDCDFIVL